VSQTRAQMAAHWLRQSRLRRRSRFSTKNRLLLLCEKPSLPFAMKKAFISSAPPQHAATVQRNADRCTRLQ